MRILFFIDILMSGGKERRLTELMKALKQTAECDFELAVMSNKIHYREVLDLNIPIHYLIRRSKKDISVTFKLYRLCKNFKPDLIHCWDSMTAVYSFPVCRLLKIKLINGMITNAPEKISLTDKKWIRSRLTFPFSDTIIGNSKAGLAAYRAPVKKSFFIHNGFDFKRIENLISSHIIRQELNITSRFIIGMVASFSTAKDYKTFFEAAHMVLDKRKDVTFIAIGSDTDSNASQNHISNEYSGFFRLLGKRTGIESYVNTFDIGILSTFGEGISNSILEYMALGKPVVATLGGGTVELVIDNETGFLVRRSDAAELARKIELLLDNAHLRRNMGSAGKERIKNFFNIDNMMKKYIEIYNRTLSFEDVPEKVSNVTQAVLND
jgi:glycosyltransferase involved in cell wall biosynthesis